MGDKSQYRFVFSLGCALVIVLCFGLIFSADWVVGTVSSTPSVETQFNLPRYLSQTEIAGPPPLNGTPRYTRYSTTSAGKGYDINWSEIKAGGPYDVVVISDSFLGGEPGQYMLMRTALEKNFSVLHIPTNQVEFCRGRPVVLLVMLTNNGFLKDVGAKYVILGLAEREILANLRATSDLNETIDVNALPVKKGKTRKNQDETRPDLITRTRDNADRYFLAASKNLTLVKTWAKNDLLSLAGEATADNTVHFADLNETRFTHPTYGSRLLYHNQEFTFRQLPYPDAIIVLNDDLNTLSYRLNRQGISLILVPGISAYTTYYAYIRDPPTSRDPFFEIMRELNRTYEFVDVKAVADEKLASGTPDLSGVGNLAHWTWRLTWDLGDRIRFVPAGPVPETPPAIASAAEYTRAAEAFRRVAFERKTDDPWAIRNENRIRAGVRIPAGRYS